MIVSTPGTLGGKPRIEGRRIGVHHVAHWRYQWGWSVETIMAEFDLTQAEVQAALDYYAENKTAIDADVAEGERIVEELRKQHPSILGGRLRTP